MMKKIKLLTRARFWPAFMLLTSFASGCSLFLDWNEDNQPCNTAPAPECDDGYSCDSTGRCISDGRIAVGEPCNKDRQCNGYPGYLCTPSPLLCRVKCRDAYYGSAGCDAKSYCRPSISSEAPAAVRGSCVASECSLTPPSGCENGYSCIPITDTANACLKPCGKSLSSTSFSCPTDFTCQPLGVGDTLMLACIKKSLVTVGIGDKCDFGGSTCGAATACIGDKCSLLCDPAVGASLPANCGTCKTDANKYNGAFGICSP